jgi:hypothetical protein
LRFHRANELARGNGGTPGPRGRLLHERWFAYGVPRWLGRCWFGHKPIVDGTPPLSGLRGTSRGCRWVCCDRCGARGEPQGSLDPEVYAIGDRYLGPWRDAGPFDPNTRAGRIEVFNAKRGFHLPGRIRRRPTTELGVELVVGGSMNWWGISGKLGNAGSENKTAAAVHVGWFGALYFSGGDVGTWWQRRLNATGYHSKHTELAVHRFDGGSRVLCWKVWAPDNTPERLPRWRDGSVNVSVRHWLFGPLRYHYTDVAEASRIVRMPEGDYLVTLVLQRQVRRRDRGPLPEEHSWTVEWTSPMEIPTRSGRGISSSAVKVSRMAVAEGTWAAEAAAAIAMAITRDRTRYGHEPTGKTPVPAGALAG